MSVRGACAILGVSWLLVSCQPAPPVPRQLSADEIRSTFVGHTDYGTLENGKRFAAYFDPNGSVRIRGDGFSDTGRYRIEAAGRMCIQYQVIRNGAEFCHALWKEGDRHYSTSDDGMRGVLIDSVRRGNPDGL